MIRTIIYFILLAPTLSFSQHYSLADLEILEKEKNFSEFLKHANDIRPSKRGRHWNGMVQNIASSFVEEKITSKIYDFETLEFLSQLGHWPALKKDEFFQAKRNRYVLRWARDCFDKHKKERCEVKVMRLWWSSNQDPEFGYQLAIVMDSKGIETHLWTLLRNTTNRNLAEFYCKRPIVQKILALQFTDKNIKGPSNLHSDCWPSFSKYLRSLLYPTNSRLSEKAFKVLSYHKKINRGDSDEFLTRYLLNGPRVGKIFNLAWNNLAQLGEDYKRRQKVFMRLKILDPLPGKIFASTDPMRKRAIGRKFHFHFAEYLEFYGRTCTEYLNGKGFFPRGNPTIECRELLTLTKDRPWLSDTVKSSYAKAIAIK